MLSLIKTNGVDKKAGFREFPALFDDFLTRDFFNVPAKRYVNHFTTPAVNVKETEAAFEIEMAAPGMDKKDFKIELEEADRITISSHKETNVEEKDEKNEKEKYTRREYSYQSFSRTFTLPENLVKSNEITANYTDGILKVIIPKKEKTELNQNREIQIS